jgi:hypothetical protein
MFYRRLFPMSKHLQASYIISKTKRDVVRKLVGGSPGAEDKRAYVLSLKTRNEMADFVHGMARTAQNFRERADAGSRIGDTSWEASFQTRLQEILGQTLSGERVSTPNPHKSLARKIRSRSDHLEIEKSDTFKIAALIKSLVPEVDAACRPGHPEEKNGEYIFRLVDDVVKQVMCNQRLAVGKDTAEQDVKRALVKCKAKRGQQDLAY